MRVLVAFFVPFVVFFTIRRPVQGVLCLLLQLTVIGWIPATIWAIYSTGQYKTDRKIAAAMGPR